jgi:hypothetical protein
MSQHAVLTAEAHRNLRVRHDRAPDLGDAVMCCLTVPDEFRRVQAFYAILFRESAARDSFTAFAMFGFEDGENLFLSDGRWDAGYLPLAMTIQPFLVGRSRDGSGPGQVHIDLGSPRISQDEGTRLFDEHARPTPYLESMAEQLGALDEGYRASHDFFAAVQRHRLLEPLVLDITLDDGATNRLVGFHVIDEGRLRGLDAMAVAELHRDGHLMPIYMALASLAQLKPLIARKNRRQLNG